MLVFETVLRGAAIGLVTGLGAASADAVYGLIVALGFGLAASILLGYTAYLQVAGGLLLLWLGIVPLLKKSGDGIQGHASKNSQVSQSLAFGSTFALTLTNPLTILSFIGAIAALSGTNGISNTANAGLEVVVGVFLGSLAWWLTLVGFITAVRTSISPSFQKTIDVLSSALLSGFGLYAIYTGSKGPF